MSSISNAENLATEGVQVPEWFARPYQLVSLLDMIPFNLKVFHLASTILAQSDELMRHQPIIEDRLGIIDDDELLKKASDSIETSNRQTLQALELIADRCTELDFEFSAEYAKSKLNKLEANFSTKEATIALGELQGHILREIARHLFMQIPHDKAKYWEQKKLFGNKVYKNFRSTREDIIEAGNCYAAGRNTACVFHCMRVLEKGLHALVHELNNTFQTNIVFSKGVEHTNWGNIIDKIESEIRELLKPTRQPRLTQNDLQFYSEAAKEFVYFKNAWRDDVSHSRSAYGEGTAKDVLEHVRAFMQHLSGRLHG
jgi:hypothetical protein